MTEPTMTRDEWVATFDLDNQTTLDFETEKALCEWGIISICDLEFGPHGDDHSTCADDLDDVREFADEIGMVMSSDALFAENLSLDDFDLGN